MCFIYNKTLKEKQAKKKNKTNALSEAKGEEEKIPGKLILWKWADAGRSKKKKLSNKRGNINEQEKNQNTN